MKKISVFLVIAIVLFLVSACANPTTDSNVFAKASNDISAYNCLAKSVEVSYNDVVLSSQKETVTRTDEGFLLESKTVRHNTSDASSATTEESKTEQLPQSYKFDFGIDFDKLSTQYLEKAVTENEATRIETELTAPELVALTGVEGLADSKEITLTAETHTKGLLNAKIQYCTPNGNIVRVQFSLS